MESGQNMLTQRMLFILLHILFSPQGDVCVRRKQNNTTLYMDELFMTQNSANRRQSPGVDNILPVQHSVSEQGSVVFTELHSSEQYPLSYNKIHPTLSVLFCPLSWIVLLLLLLPNTKCSVLADMFCLWLYCGCSSGKQLWKMATAMRVCGMFVWKVMVFAGLHWVVM